MKNKKLEPVRKKLDKLDLKILSLIKKRTILVNQVVKIKKFKSQIVDKKRIKQVLRKIRSNSVKKKIDPKITQKIWKSMIASYINYERRKFKEK